MLGVHPLPAPRRPVNDGLAVELVEIGIDAVPAQRLHERQHPLAMRFTVVAVADEHPYRHCARPSPSLAGRS